MIVLKTNVVRNVWMQQTTDRAICCLRHVLDCSFEKYPTQEAGLHCYVVCDVYVGNLRKLRTNYEKNKGRLRKNKALVGFSYVFFLVSVGCFDVRLGFPGFLPWEDAESDPFCFKSNKT